MAEKYQVPKGYRKVDGKFVGEKEGFLVQAVDSDGNVYGPISCQITGKLTNDIKLIDRSKSKE